ncbi:MAG TPA: BTAD domain-containing putative transcriptional regulator [Actinospica sp.]|jgi:predicted ATPase/DNA-binding SARP family transcriptional activator|nr:BTAD domain-containing putative transcriptional regulator [Actinospica sp.]
MGVELVLLPRVAFRGREIAGARLGGLLALLAEDLRAGCSTGRLVGGVWGDEGPEHPTRALQVLVSRARAQLGAETIVSTPVGYRLVLGADQVDATWLLECASEAARRARAGDAAGAIAQAEAGLGVWKGEDVSELGDPLSELRAARARTCRELVRVRALSLCRLDRRAEAAETLRELIRSEPRDEEVLAQLLLHEAATLGPSSALARYDAYRRGLRDELGSDPGAELQRVYGQLLEREKPTVRRGVEHEPNTLLGRDGDITAVQELLTTARVVSIIGPGGLGKTRMAHAVAGGVRQRVVHLVALAGVTADDDVAGEVASALGVGEHMNVPGGGARPGAAADAVAGILAALGSGSALLVLDNCEHVLRGAADLVRALVARSEDLRVLTTSRTPLGLSSESVYLLPALSPSTSVELFRQRANAARPGVELPEDVVRRLCERLDGLPLAVELAAARVRVMGVAEIARRLDDRFSILRGTARDAPERHRTLHAVIDWSWNLLTADGQAAMRTLSIFPGGFTAEAARHVLTADDEHEVLEALVDQSLLQVADSGSGTRFRMLETVREFSAARRAEAGSDDEVVGRFLAWARDFGVMHHEAMFGADLVTSAASTRDEQENLMLALRLGLDSDNGSTVASACAVLGALWMFQSDFARMSALVGQTAGLLSHLRPAPEDLEVTRTAVVMAALSALILRHPASARALVTLRRLPSAPPDTPARATAIVLATLAGARDETQSAIEALQELCDSDEPLLAAMANTTATFVWQGVNEPDIALKAAQSALASFEGHAEQFPWFQVMTHSRIGELCLDLGRGDEAHEHFATTLSLLEELPGLNVFEAGAGVSRLRSAMVLANLQRGAVDEAEHWLEVTLREGGEQDAGLPTFDVVARAEILLARGEVEDGLRLWREATDVLRDLRGREGGEPFQESWAREVEAMAVIAHAQHGRLALVGELTGRFPRAATRLIADAAVGSTMSYADFPHFGKLLLALAVLDIDRGNRTGDTHATTAGARMIALAERFRVKCGFEPTMSVDRVRRMAEQADGPAYVEAVSTYAGLDADALRDAAAQAVLARGRFSGQHPHPPA